MEFEEQVDQMVEAKLCSRTSHHTRWRISSQCVRSNLEVRKFSRAGQRGGDEYLCRFGSGSRSICAVGDVTVVPGVVVLINTIAADDSHQLLRQLRLVVACFLLDFAPSNVESWSVPDECRLTPRSCWSTLRLGVEWVGLVSRIAGMTSIEHIWRVVVIKLNSTKCKPSMVDMTAFRMNYWVFKTDSVNPNWLDSELAKSASKARKEVKDHGMELIEGAIRFIQTEKAQSQLESDIKESKLNATLKDKKERLAAFPASPFDPQLYEEFFTESPPLGETGLDWVAGVPITLIPTIKYNSIQPKVPLIVNNDPVMVLNDENVLETAHEPSAEQKLIKDPFVAERIRDGN
ncbi:hypothetical protein AT4G08097 [Arabidopsis thaliana]|uniref:Uncharacterized protein n=1 Tax=Arabidopsis thaliana TaxID=3702 RepID=F4JG15_ARATH|nr:uncharacterized protein AT4G08097 [Arabidopsis thaliana]AEE82595.1 hypothetical protein AT4G08097 [Arabidopsis thaliana]|eukprot:NP_680648.1 hypothetical protein AT4G08097 [Arabidopsis thaliana]